MKYLGKSGNTSKFLLLSTGVTTRSHARRMAEEHRMSLSPPRDSDGQGTADGEASNSDQEEEQAQEGQGQEGQEALEEQEEQEEGMQQDPASSSDEAPPRKRAKRPSARTVRGRGRGNERVGRSGRGMQEKDKVIAKLTDRIGKLEKLLVAKSNITKAKGKLERLNNSKRAKAQKALNKADLGLLAEMLQK